MNARIAQAKSRRKKPAPAAANPAPLPDSSSFPKLPGKESFLHAPLASYVGPFRRVIE